MVQEYIVLDLETTGLDPLKDKIIEVGAVKINKDGIISTYSSFVNPKKNIPDYIVHLTSISNDDVKDAPLFKDIKDDLLNFISTTTIVGQFINFDLSFLAQEGIIFDNDILDTREIAMITMPALSSFSLSNLIKELKINNDNPHKALSDAKATADVFLKLSKKLNNADPITKIKLSLLCERNNSWISKFIKIELNHNFANSSELFVQLLTLNKLSLKDDNILTPTKISNDYKSNIDPNNLDFNEIFNELRKMNYDIIYEEREGQVELSESIYSCLVKGGRLLAEAGPGLGKSLAYLIASSVYAIKFNTNVVISTYRNDLQNQLYYKDYKDVKNVLKNIFIDSSLKISLLKGRQNYICMYNYSLVLSDDTILNDEEYKFYSRIATWTSDTLLGDISEINLNKRENILWRQLNANESDCLKNDAVHKILGECFLLKARNLAEDANIVIVNHSLLFSNVTNNQQILPSFDNLIMDEAHQINDVASNQFALEINFDSVQKFLSKNIIPETTNVRNKVIDLSISSSNLNQIESSFKELQSESENGIAILRKLNKLIKAEFFELQSSLKFSSNKETQIPLTGPLVSHPSWLNIQHSIKESKNYFHKLSRVLQNNYEILIEYNNKKNKDIIYYRNTIKKLINILESIIFNLEEYVYSSNYDYLICVNSGINNIGLTIRPTDIGELIDFELYQSKSTIIATSATLNSFDGSSYNFHFIAKQIGMTDAKSISIDAPYNYRDKVLGIAISDISPPNDNYYEESIAEYIIDTANILDGKTLVLFTSNQTLEKVSNIIINSKHLKNINVLTQGLDGKPFQLLKKFNDNPKSVLLGTSSFWEGVDIPSKNLDCVMVSRLPFMVPSDPVLLANTVNDEDSFNSYLLPAAILKFRQGFGRLIRSDESRGVFIVLDSRIITKSYGKYFLDALNEIDILPVKIRDTHELLVDWKNNES